jgi:3-phenylpropionate/cinnamic acid dioxygenase small subunit
MMMLSAKIQVIFYIFNAESRADLRAWHEFIDNFNGKLCFIFDAWISSDTLRLYSDAAGVHGG